MRSIRITLILAGKQLRILWRMPGILLVIFVPGIVMYTVFTSIFAGPAGRPFRAAVVDLDQSEASRELIAALEKNNVTVIRNDSENGEERPLTVELAREHIRKKGKYRVAVVIPQGFHRAPNVLAGPEHVGVELIHDETQAIEADAIAGMIQMAAGRQLFEKMHSILGGPAAGSGPRGDAEPGHADAAGESATAPAMLIHVQRVGVAINRMKIAAKHTFLAGIVPMFLLFGPTGAARGMLEDIKSGESARLLVAPVTPVCLVAGGICAQFVLSLLQCYSMYVFAWLVFDVAIWSIGSPLFVLTMATCTATTGFGILMGSVVRTTQQLDSIGTIVILAMSALGGSMVPRMVMPDWMQPFGLFTINGWSFDGFIALIRNEGFGLAALRAGEPVQGIWVPCLVLLGVAAACLGVGSFLISRRMRAGIPR